MLDVESLADILTVGDITRHHARTHRDRVAIYFEGRRTTFGELDRRANHVANGLIAEGMRPQTRIAYPVEKLPGLFRLLVRRRQGRCRAGAGQFPPGAA